MSRRTNTVPDSAFANHLVNSGHKYSNINDNLSILHVHRGGKYLDALEEYSIYKAVKYTPHNVLNDKLSFQSNIIYDTAIKVENNTVGRRQTNVDNR